MGKEGKATAKALLGLVNDLTDQQLLALTDSENRPAIKKVLCEMIASPAKKSVLFHATVRYNQPEYEELKSAFDWVSDEYKYMGFQAVAVCKKIKTTTRKVTFQYVRMNRKASTNDVLIKMHRLGLRPALYEEGLAFAKAYPDEGKKFSIVILGSVWRQHGYNFVASLYNDDDGKRCLNLGACFGDWDNDCCFLAVPKDN